MSDILLNEETHDIDLAAGDLPIASGSALIAQNIKQRLLLLFGEHFLDTSQGVPYKEQILRKNPDIQVASSILKERILGTEGVGQLTNFSLSIDPAARKCFIYFRAVTEAGETISQQVEV